MAHHDTKGIQFNWAAFLGGPYWAVARGMWLLFWISYTIEILFLGTLIAAESPTVAKVIAAIILVCGRLGLGLTANHSYWQAFCTWRVEGRSSNRFQLIRLQ